MLRLRFIYLLSLKRKRKSRMERKFTEKQCELCDKLLKRFVKT